MFNVRTPVFPLSLVALLLLLTSALAQAVELPRQEAVPGGIAIIDLGTGAQAPKAFYKDKPVMVVRNQDRWHAVVGIPLSTRPGKHFLRTQAGEHKKTYAFQVVDKAYKAQHITLKDKRKVNPNAEDMKRIRQESKLIKAALSHWDDTLYASSPLLDMPAKGPLSSPFGLRRFFNGQPRKPHSGIDIAAPENSPITAPARGKVILTGKFFFNGNSVFIDHGEGLITMYCHMNRIDVTKGDIVERGQQIGIVGKTGRVTGPHVHWGVSMNDARIDPNLVMSALQQAAQAK